MSDPIDIHCPHCNQIIVPSDKMRSLANWKDERGNQSLLVADMGPAVMLNVDFMCKTCGNMVYFRLNEQRLKLLINKVK